MSTKNYEMYMFNNEHTLGSIIYLHPFQNRIMKTKIDNKLLVQCVGFSVHLNNFFLFKYLQSFEGHQALFYPKIFWQFVEP